MSKETPHRMHWWFFVDKLVPWIFAGALLAILLAMSGMVSDRFALPANLYSRIQISTVALIAIGAVSSVLISAVQWSCTRLTIEEDQLVYAKGVLNRTVAKIPIQEIASIDLHQTLFQRIMGTGDLLVDMRGASLLRMKLLDDPEAIQNAVLSLRRKPTTSQ